MIEKRGSSPIAPVLIVKPTNGMRAPSDVPLLEPEADEEDPDREHRAEHAEYDARCHQIGASEGVHEQPQPAGEDEPGAELTEEEANEAVARDAARRVGRVEGRQRRQAYVAERDHHQLDAERL